MDPDIARLAERQHGIVARHQLVGAGVGPDTVDTWVQRGVLRWVSRATYRLPGAPLTPRAEMVAAALRCGPAARVAGERLLAVVGVSGAAVDGPFVVLTRPGRAVTGVDWRWREDVAPGRDSATLDGIPGVTPARNLLEVAVHRSDRDLERLVDGCRWAGNILPRVERLVREVPGHPGARRLAGSGLLGLAASESPKEREMVAALAGLGVETQVWLTRSIRVDALIRRARLVLEYDGEATHTGEAATAADARRDEAIRALGYAVEHVRASDLIDPHAFRARIAALVDVLAR